MTRRIVDGRVEDSCPRCGVVIADEGADLQSFAAEVTRTHPDAVDVRFSTLLICEACGHSWLEAETTGHSA